jgi:hypothetical protein
MKSNSRPIYFTKLELENIRSFGGRQCLDLLDTQAKPARWTLILGDNAERTRSSAAGSDARSMSTFIISGGLQTVIPR